MDEISLLRAAHGQVTMRIRLSGDFGLKGGLVVILLLCFMAANFPAIAAQQASVNVVQPGSPGKPSKALPAETKATSTFVSADDVAFMQGMIMHHQQAVEMTALIPERTTNKQLLDLGKRISLSQSDEIKFMRHWLEARGQSTTMEMRMHGSEHAMPVMMPGMLTTQQMDALRNAKAREFDRLFLTGMIQHHGGALVMVKQLFDSAGAGQDAELFDFATDVDNTQRAEIALMERLLKENK